MTTETHNASMDHAVTIMENAESTLEVLAFSEGEPSSEIKEYCLELRDYANQLKELTELAPKFNTVINLLNAVAGDASTVNYESVTYDLVTMASEACTRHIRSK